MGFDDLDDLLGGDDELEAAFRELDAQLKMEELRTQGGRSTASARKSKSKGATRRGPADPLKDLKAAFDGEAAPKKRARKAPAKRYLVVVCPSCGAKNRVPLERLKKKLPVCGRCKTDLSFLR